MYVSVEVIVVLLLVVYNCSIIDAVVPLVAVAQDHVQLRLLFIFFAGHLVHLEI